jgi:hypothetical protein
MEFARCLLPPLGVALRDPSLVGVGVLLVGEYLAACGTGDVKDRFGGLPVGCSSYLEPF